MGTTLFFGAENDAVFYQAFSKAGKELLK